MTDVAAVASYLVDGYDKDASKVIARLFGEKHRRFSPIVTACLTESDLVASVTKVLSGDGRNYYREIYDNLGVTASSSVSGTPEQQ